MTIKLPRIIQQYVDASNRHDVKAMLACFSEDALIRDEGKEIQGKSAIENWVVTTIGKYKFQFKPLGFKDDHADMAVSVEVSGTFAGSPVTLDYHFKIENDEILSLEVV